MTPHIEANKGDYAETVLLPGDPLRAKWIAETFFDNPVQVNGVRNCLGYTGTYAGKKISVQAGGMGMPSNAIYITELFKDYGVQNIIRVGSCGAIQKNIKVGDRFYTPYQEIEKSISAKTIFNSKGLKN